MKIDRVIFCLNNNKTYTGFWNPFSRVWKQKYNIKPTLMFVGTKEELESNDFSEEWGEIYRLDPVEDVIVDPNLDWSTTWALFYGSSLFEDEVCLTAGIDQLPLSNNFFNFLLNSDEIGDDKYVIALADAYKDFLPNVYPSSWHIAKGSTYKRILQLDSDWERELKKVFSHREKYPTLPENFWALDELYSSDIINQYAKQNEDNKIVCFQIFHKVWAPARLDRAGRLKYDKDFLQAGRYSEIHCPRPFEEHEEYLLKLIEDLL